MGDFVNYCAGVHGGILPSDPVEAILINVAQNANNDKAIRNTLEMLVAARTRHIMLDSGGYQLFTNELKGGYSTSDPTKPLLYRNGTMNLAPIHVIQAGVKIQPTKITALDSPVLKLSDPDEQRREFHKKLGINLKWMTETSRLRSRYCPNIELYIPIQCYDLDQFSCIEPTLQTIQFDGLSLPTRNLDPAGIALFLIKFYQIGVRKVHLLSVSNFSGIALAAYFAQNVFDAFSIDATTWRQDAQYGFYLHPGDMKKIGVRDGASFNENISLPCTCPWCSRTTFTEIKNLPGSEKTDFLRRHNYQVIQKLGREFYAIAGDFNSFLDHLRLRNQRQSGKIQKLIDALTIVNTRRDDPIEILRQILGSGKL